MPSLGNRRTPQLIKGNGRSPVWALTPHARAGVFHRRDACAPCLALLTYRLHNSERWYEGQASGLGQMCP